MARVSFDHQSPTFFSSTLVELHINVYRFNDCLYLLAGRLPQLHTLFVKVFHIISFHSSMTKKVNYFATKSLVINYIFLFSRKNYLI